MCGGGGGGPSAAELKREEDLRALKTAQSIASVNSIFGLTDPDAYKVDNDLLDERAKLEERLKPVQIEIPAERSQDDGNLSFRRRPAPEPQYRTGYAFELEPRREDRFAGSGDTPRRESRPEVTAAIMRSQLDSIPTYDTDGYTKRAAVNAKKISGQYDTTKDDIIAYLTEDLNRQRDEAAQNMKISLAQRGLVGGQASIDSGADLLSAYNKGNLDITNRADSAVSDLKSRDDTARRNLIAQVTNGMDSSAALSAATRQMTNNVNSVRDAQMSQALGSIFSDFAEKYNFSQYTKGQQQAKSGPPVSASGAAVNQSDYSGTVR